MHPVETYLRELLDIHRSGEAVKETSYYSPLSNLFNEIGKTLKPKVSCIINIKNRGAGIPDGGLFTAEQLQKVTATEPYKGLVPVRGVIEIKGTNEDVQRTARSEQVLRYLQRYGQVLITNYRDFILLGQSSANKPLILETYHLTQSETDFWNAAAHPRQIVAEQGERFIEYLKRVMLHAAPLANPEDVAWFLASYARDAKARIEHSNLAALTVIRADLEKALSITFKGTKGEHFFRSTLVQTLFYGVFSAWVLCCKQQDNARPARFDWRLANWFLHVPMIKALFEQVVTPSKLGPLGLVEVLNWAGEALNRVDQKAFFAKFEETYAVQYFYEPFLQAFDPELRKELGIWYTPPEIVQYMVARVDTALREELDIEDGLADPRVYVLDPCCGTGAYLVEVLKRIATTLQEKGEDALGGHDIKAAAEQRVFGFELLPAPFVIAHLQLGLLLQNLGTPLSDEKNERVGVYLTNSLTNWDLPHSTQEKVVQLQLAIPELQEERDAAEHIKQQIPILVVLGNPFDLQWCYYSPVRPLWREPRPEYWAAYDIGSPALVTRFKTASSYEGSPIMFTRNLCDYHMMPPNSSIFPVVLRPSSQKHGNKGTKQTTLIHESMRQPQANLSPTALAYLATLAITNTDSDANTATLIWMHALAISYAPTYLTENVDGIKQDWPRIPLPDSKEMLQASADLGHQVAMLLDTESPISGVTTGKIRPEVRSLAVISRAGGGTLNPDAGDLALTAGWGHGGNGNNITMPGKGKVLFRDYTTQEWTAIVEGASVLNLTPDQVKEHLGATTYDIYLNNIAYWRNIPSRVWEYTIGGYQVIKKWLSYREFPLLGRALFPDEVREVTSIVRRIAALLLLEPMLNDNYHSIKQSSYRWTFSEKR